LTPVVTAVAAAGWQQSEHSQYGNDQPTFSRSRWPFVEFKQIRCQIL
jgi:hypothetical protein